MISITLAFMMTARQEVAPEWRQVPVNSSVIDCVGLSGVGVVASGKVDIFKSDGTKVKSVKVPSGFKPLWYSSQAGLVVAAEAAVVEHAGEADQRTSMESPLSLWAQHGFTFVQSQGVALLGKVPPLALPQFDPFSGVGIDPRGNALVLICRPMRAASMYVFRRVEGGWFQETFVRGPEIERAALLGIPNRFNDVRVTSAGYAFYLAQVTGVLSQPELEKADKACLDWTHVTLESYAGRGGKQTFYLVCTRLSDGYTIPYARMQVGFSGERGNAKFGRMSSSEDGRYLFVVADKSILRVDTSNVRKRTGL